MKKEIQLLKQKADSALFLIEQIQTLEQDLVKYTNTQKNMILEGWYEPKDMDSIESQISQVNSQIEQYERQIMEL